MKSSHPLRLSLLALLASSLLALPAVRAAADQYDDLLKKLEWRNVGPAIMGGRINDFAVVEKDPKIVYAATASGGLFKTVNNGTTWKPLFDDQSTSSIGDVTIAPSNPEIVWVGTGEANNRQSSSWGNGVYKSTDGGEKWEFMGLADSHHIGRIVIHPTNPDIVYVAANGRLWGPNKERGVFLTTDGGKTWNNILFINEDTGCTDIAMDPENSDILYAAMYQRRRTAFGFNGGGPGSGLHKSTDGGKTWKKLTEGLPTTDLGRIGIGIYRKDPKIVYAILETRNGNISGSNSGSTYRSEDRGETWTKTSDINPRPMYYSQIVVDPNNDKTVWVMGASMYTSFDGAKTFSTRFAQRIHSDFHAMWINPADSNHIILGSDGGIHWSYDKGQTWDFVNTIPLAQFYEITYDMQKPYNVYGGLQDNGTWKGPSGTTFTRGISNDEWTNVGGGDGFYAQVSPTDPNVLYTESQNGNAARFDQRTGERKSIRPRAPQGETYRFDWNTPLLISPHDHNKIYMAGNRLFISNDRGDSWRRTEDLTTKPDRSKMSIFGGPVTNRTLSANDGQDDFGHIVTVTESPLKPGLLYVGTDDGLVHTSKDDGQTWQNITDRFPGVPKGTYVTRVVASAHEASRAYVTFDGHRSNDFTPYVFVTEDYGQTWKKLATGIPEGSTVNVIREHFRNPNLLFAGTERGLYTSFNRGTSWRRVPAPLPMVPVDDIQIHPRENDLILGTHGRGAFIADDITFLEQAERAQSYAGYLFDPRPAVAYRFYNHKASTGHKLFLAPNPPSGAMIQFFLKQAPEESSEVNLTILDKDGKNVVRTLRPFRLTAGVNKITWDLRYDSPTSPPEGAATMRGSGPGQRAGGGRQGGAQTGAATGQGQPPAAGRPAGAQAGAAGQGQRPGGGRPGGFGGGGGGMRAGFGLNGPRVLPGTYLVRLEVGSETYTRPIQVEEDPRLAMLAKERKVQFDTQMRLGGLLKTVSQAQRSLQEIRAQVAALQEKDGMKSAPKALQTSVTALTGQVDKLQSRIAPRFRPQQRPRSSGEGGEEGSGEPASASSPQPREEEAPVSPTLPRITSLLTSISAITEAPSRASLTEMKTLESEVKRLVQEINTLKQKTIPELNKQLKVSQLEPLSPGERVSVSQK